MSTRMHLIICLVCAIIGCGDIADSVRPYPVAPTIPDAQASSLLNEAKQIGADIAPKVRDLQSASMAEAYLQKVYSDRASPGLLNIILDDGNVFGSAKPAGSLMWSFDVGVVTANDGGQSILIGTYGRAPGDRPGDVWIVYQRVTLASGEADLLCVFSK